MAGNGAVKIESFKGRLRLRWSYRGKRYCLTMGLYDRPLAWKVAEGKANAIEADLMTGNFDPTLAKYKTAAAGATLACGITAVALFQKFTSHRGKGLAKRALEKYSTVEGKLVRHFQDRPADIDADAAEGFRLWLSEELAPVSQKEYLRLTCSCWEWGMKQGLITANPWGEVVKRVQIPPKQAARPFTTIEMQAILEGFKGSRYYAYYTDFVRFMLGTGCRTGEAVGLRWAHLSDDCGTVWIGESLSRGVRKSTKTNRAREFRLSESTRAMLLNRRPDGCKPDDLVFSALNGGPIDGQNFRNRAWTAVLKQAGVTYRKPYNTRHTFISHALKSRQNPMTTSRMTGHDPEVLFRNYAADIDDGLQCPEILG
jgi:integrase